MDQREHPRIHRGGVIGLDVLVVPVEGRVVHGRLVDMSATGAGVQILASEQPSLADAERVVLIIGAHQLDPPLTAAAITLHQETKGVERHVGFRFVDPEALMETLTGSFQSLFNARGAERVRAQPHEPITVALCFFERSGEEERFDGKLDDISATGLSVELPVEVYPDAVTEGAVVRLVVRLPGTNAELPLTGIVRDCVPLGDRWRVGIEFDPGAPNFEASQADIVAYVERRRAEEAG
jgi:hypothetical protein